MITATILVLFVLAYVMGGRRDVETMLILLVMCGGLGLLCIAPHLLMPVLAHQTGG
jgi:hypothetical protein